MEDMTEGERAAAFADICQLKARRDRAVDVKDWATYEALHAPDHYSHNDGMPRMEGAANMVRQVSRLMADVTSVHHSHAPDITFETPTKARGIWGMEDNLFWKQGGEDHWLRGFGFYHETYEKRRGQWVFTSRRLERVHVQTSPSAKSNEVRADERDSGSTA